MTSPSFRAGPHNDTELDEPSVPLAPVTEMLKLFARAVRAHQLYLPNNPMHARALYAVRTACTAVWEQTDALTLTVTENQFQFEGHPVLEEGGRGGDSLPWLFFKDGIRLLELRPGFEETDLQPLLDAVQHARARAEDSDDLVTLLWECDFQHLQYRYIDLVTDEGVAAPGAELLRGGVPMGMIASPRELEAGGVPVVEGGSAGVSADADTPGDDGDGAASAASPFARIEDYSSTLYFLDPGEVAYLEKAIIEEFSADLCPPVVAALLDVFEQETSAAVRDEICGILDALFLMLLTTSQFGAVAFLLREAAAAAERADDLTPAHRTRLAELADQTNDPAVFGQLLQALEELDVGAHRGDIDMLFGRLKPVVLAPLLTQLSRTRGDSLRALLEDVADRLAARHTGELIALISSEDHGVALEAVSRAGVLRSPVAVGPLARLLIESDVELRRAAVQALVGIGSAGAMQALERAVDDDDRDVRLIAVRAIADRQHRAALPRVERALKERMLHENQHATEKSVFFDTYASLGGEAAIALLDGILNPKGFLTKKSDPQTRACAATALGKLGTPRAVDALRRAAGDKEIIVRTAAARALRGPGEGA